MESPDPDKAKISRVGEIRVDPAQLAFAASTAGTGAKSRTSRHADGSAILTVSPDTAGADRNVSEPSCTANPRYASAGAALTMRRARIQTVPGSRSTR